MGRKTVDMCPVLNRIHVLCGIFFLLKKQAKKIDIKAWYSKDEKDPPGCCQRKVNQRESVVIVGCISSHEMGELDVCVINAGPYRNFRQTRVTIKGIPFPERSMIISTWKCQTSFFMSCNSMTFWTQAVCALLACSTDPSLYTFKHKYLQWL